MAGNADSLDQFATARRSDHRWAVALLVGLLVVLAVGPPLAGPYPTHVMGNVLVLGLFAAGFNLLFGFTGLLSFGHAGLYAVGGYVSALLLKVYPSLPAAIILGTLAAGVASVVIGYLSIRHTRVYFAMLTLALGMLIHSVVFKWRDVTGGDDGIVGVPRGVLGLPGLFGVELTPNGLYWLTLGVAAVALYLLWRLLRSPLGLVLRGLRDSETRVAFSGLSVRRYRLIAFTLSGLYAGLAGSLAVPLTSSASPSMAHWTTSAEPIFASLLGGMQYFSGPLVGAFLFVIFKEVIVRFTEYWSLALGAAVVLLVLGFRGGVVYAVTKAVRDAKRRIGR